MSAPPFAVNPRSLVAVLIERGYRIGSYGPFGPSGVHLRVARRGRDGGTIVITQSEHDDGNEWLHASIAYPDAMPTYDDLVALHRAVFGRKRWAYQVFAPESEHVNIHSYALHIWGRADGKPALPRFAQDGSI